MLAVFLYSCEKDSTDVIDPQYTAPVIVSTSLSVDTVRTTSASPQINFDVDAVVTSTNPINTVTATLYNSLNEFVGEYQLQNVGGNNYSGNINVTGISCLLVGIYKLQLVADDQLGLFSNLIIISVPVVNTANQPIILSNPMLPDSVVRPTTGFFDLTISIDATDLNGKCDIVDIFFYGYRPTGFPLNNGQPFIMTNPAGNRYEYTAPVTPAAEDSLYGYYKYVFQGRDRSGVLSAQYLDSIKFVRP